MPARPLVLNSTSRFWLALNTVISALPDVVPEAGFACKSNRAMDVVAVLVDSTVNADPAVPSDWMFISAFPVENVVLNSVIASPPPDSTLKLAFWCLEYTLRFELPDALDPPAGSANTSSTACDVAESVVDVTVITAASVPS